MLVADTGGPSGGISCYAGVQASRSLVELADQLAAGLPARTADLRDRAGRLRVLATGPRFARRVRATSRSSELLADAREAHGLTVIDCGTLAREADQIARRAPRTSPGCCPRPATAWIRGARAVLEAIAPPHGREELIVARHDAASQGAAARAQAARRAPPRAAGAAAPPPRPRRGRTRPGARDSAGAAAGDPRSARSDEPADAHGSSGHRTHRAATSAPARRASAPRSDRRSALPDRAAYRDGAARRDGRRCSRSPAL